MRDFGGSTQMRFEECPEWVCGIQAPRPDQSGSIFNGNVSGVTPAVPLCVPELRRRDVGSQKYGSGTPTFNGDRCNRDGVVDGRPNSFLTFPTSHGPIAIGEPMRQDLGWMPTVEGVLFLRDQYPGSRLQDAPLRYNR